MHDANYSIGQRYDVIITADQSAVADSFWIRAIPQSACSENDSQDNIRGILSYGASSTTPSTSRPDSYFEGCEDMDAASLVPHVAKSAGTLANKGVEEATVGFNEDRHFRWFLNSTTMLVEWADPTLLSIFEGETSWDTSDAVIELPNADEWVLIVIETALSIPHPIHLHGHDFLVLAQGAGTYSSSITLNTENPPRRDTAMLPASGYLAIAFQTDNPGAWLMHCHIGWHTSEGFSLQFIERYDEIIELVDSEALTNTCEAWSAHVEVFEVEQEDSGL